MPHQESRAMSDIVKRWSLGLYAPGNYHCICSECSQQFVGDKRAIQCLTCAAEKAAARIAQFEAENASLASWQCEFTDGKTGLVYGEGGSTYCAMAKRVQKLEAMLREVMEQCPEHVPYGLKNQIRAVLGVSDDQ